MTTENSRADALTDAVWRLKRDLERGNMGAGTCLVYMADLRAILAASPVEQPEKSLAPEGGSEARGRWIQANCPTGDIIESPSPSNNREFPTSMSESDCEHRIALAPSQPAAAPLDKPSVNDTITFSGDSLTLSGAQLLEALDFIAPDRDADQLESEVTIQYGEGHTGKGMYCWCTEYPEEGAIFIDGSTAVPAAPAPSPADERPAFDILAHLQRQREFSERTFGPGARTAGICDHIRKELKEIEADPGDLTEWIDVVILALDGAWRAGGSPQQIIGAIVAKQTKNEGRTWPDWRTVPADKAIEHDRSQDACQQCHGKGTVVFRDPEDAFDVTCGVCGGSGQARAASANETGAEVSHCQCPACRDGVIHASDCAVHNAPAMPKGPCDCDAVPAMAAEAVAIPAGWKLVPIEPTVSMLVDGFESWPDPIFSTPEEWGAFEKMTGCQQATHKARLCYSAMLAAAPRPAQADARVGLTAMQLATIRLGLTAAKHFIANGIELGFIRMPDANCPDPAHDTPKLVDEALALLQGANHAE